LKTHSSSSSTWSEKAIITNLSKKSCKNTSISLISKDQKIGQKFKEIRKLKNSRQDLQREIVPKKILDMMKMDWRYSKHGMASNSIAQNFPKASHFSYKINKVTLIAKVLSSKLQNVQRVVLTISMTFSKISPSISGSFNNRWIWLIIKADLHRRRWKFLGSMLWLSKTLYQYKRSNCKKLITKLEITGFSSWAHRLMAVSSK